MKKKHIILAISGASGSLYAKLLFRELEKYKDNIGKAVCLLSENAKSIWRYELDEEPLIPGFFSIYEMQDFGSPVASGSSFFDTMIICPASMGTLGRIASGTSDNLMIRAADVMLKEKRQLILVPRETPFSLIHLNNLSLLANAGATIIPAIPSFYSKPSSMEELAMTVVDRIMVHAGFPSGVEPWGEGEE